MRLSGGAMPADRPKAAGSRSKRGAHRTARIDVGHWEQIGKENRRWNPRSALLSLVCAVAGAIVLWLLVLSQFL